MADSLEYLDGIGASCATLTPLIAGRMRALGVGDQLEVVTDDPTAPDALASWARLTGNRLLEASDAGAGHWRFVIERNR